MGTFIELGANSGAADGFRQNFPLERDLDQPVVIDARALGQCHPMFLLRLRLFVDWHLGLGHEVSVRRPIDGGVGQHLAYLRVADGLPDGVLEDLPPPGPGAASVLVLQKLKGDHDVEDAAAAATEVLGEQSPALAMWSDAAYMAMSELCGNSVEHGRNDLGTYVVADRVGEPQPTFRLVVADLGIGIPEHIRAQHPEWQDDSAAITRVLDRGVTGTGDPHRGNGFAEVLELGLSAQLRRASSALKMDIRSAKGRVAVDLFDETFHPSQPGVGIPRRGTWITYEILTASV